MRNIIFFSVLLVIALTSSVVGQISIPTERFGPKRLKAGTQYLDSPVFSPDGKNVAYAINYTDFDLGTIYVLDLVTGRERKIGESPTKTIFASLAFSPDGKTLASGGGDHTVRLWTVTTGQMRVLKKVAPGAGVVSHLVFSESGKKLAAVSEGATYLWNLPNSEPEIFRAPFVPSKFLNESSLIGWNAGHFYSWRPDAGESGVLGDSPRGTVLRLESESKAVPMGYNFAISPDNKYGIAAVQKSDGLLIWDFDTGKSTQLLRWYGNILAFSPDGKTLAINADRSDVYLFDFESLLRYSKCRVSPYPDNCEVPRPRQIFKIDGVDSIAFSRDGRLILVRTWANSLSLFAPDITVQAVAKGPNPMISVKRMGSLSWRVILPPGDWQDTGLPMISGTRVKVESSQQFIFRINHKLIESYNPSNDPYGGSGGYYVIKRLCEGNCSDGLSFLAHVDIEQVAPYFLETIQMKSLSTMNKGPQEITIEMTYEDQFENADSGRRQQHLDAVSRFQMLLNKIPR